MITITMDAGPMERTITITTMGGKMYVSIDARGFSQGAERNGANGPSAADVEPVGDTEGHDADDTEGPEDTRKQWTAKDDRRLKELWKSGLSQKSIGEEMGWGRKTIGKHMRRLGLPTSRW